MSKYDIAAYVWPSYTGKELRSRIFWPDGEGEWQTVRKATPKFEGHLLPRIPTLGYKDEALPETMEEQIELASSHGVNVFIYDWYWYDRRPFLEQCLDDGFLKAKNRSKMKFWLMWANHDATNVWDKRTAEIEGVPVWLGSQDREQFDIVCDRVIEKYFSQPEYYKVDGCPVFAIYDIDNLIKGLGGIDATKAALASFREKTAAAGFPGLNLQLILWGNTPHNITGVDGEKLYTGDIANILGFDSATNYQYVHFADVSRTYAEVMETVPDKWREFSELGPTYYPHVSIGWDNNPRYSGYHGPVMKDNTPGEFEKALRAAKAFADEKGVNIITVNSWNEWTEMSYLLPDNIYGTGYLDAIRNVFL